MTACPFCDSGRISLRRSRPDKAGDVRVWYRCDDCGAAGPPVVASCNTRDGASPNYNITAVNARQNWNQRAGLPVVNRADPP